MLLLLHETSEEREGKAGTKEAEMNPAIWNSSVLDLHWDIRVHALLEVDLLSDGGREASSGGEFDQLLSQHFQFIWPRDLG